MECGDKQKEEQHWHAGRIRRQQEEIVAIPVVREPVLGGGVKGGGLAVRTDEAQPKRERDKENAGNSSDLHPAPHEASMSMSCR